MVTISLINGNSDSYVKKQQAVIYYKTTYSIKQLDNDIKQQWYKANVILKWIRICLMALFTSGNISLTMMRQMWRPRGIKWLVQFSYMIELIFCNLQKWRCYSSPKRNKVACGIFLYDSTYNLSFAKQNGAARAVEMFFVYSP